ncbi:alpha/beta hydrolase [Volucribacter amazonae]|uniref:Alpha/beta superfamily hydrolase n=1 Tax=Volucribacter amazonae TaxID=256731 RepID=A0A9X4PBI8_9PAST|nr:alpha/beta hydrolase-fold protein [Volucribacter amazonae]MDG6896105.1 hypothetical protein [Volucribacter amazonae]
MFKKCSLIFIYLSLSFFAQAQINQKIPMINPQVVDYYQISEHDLTFNQQAYRLFIAQPKQPQQSQRVIYVLDGNAQFPLAVNAVDPHKPLPFIVGLGYPVNMAYPIAERTRDYTFATSGEQFAQGGGAKTFLHFMQQKVLPFVQQHYLNQHKAQRQMLVGHSFGGLFALYTLLQQGNLFSDYVIASPSLWWGNGEIVQQLPASLTSNIQHIQFYLGEYEANPEQDPTISAERLARIQQRRQSINTENFVALLQQRYPKQEIAFQLIAKQNHGGVIPFVIKLAVASIQQ